MKLFFKISSFYFFYFTLVAIYIIFMPKILKTLGYSSFEIGFIFSLGPLMRFLLPFFFLNKIQLTKNIFYFCLSLTLFSAIMFYFTIQNFYFFIIPNILLGVAFGVILPFVETHALGYLKKEKYGKSRLFGSVGFMLCGLVLARELKTYDVGLHYFLIAAFFVTLFGFLIASHDKKTAVVSAPINEPFRFKKVIYLWIGLFLMQTSMGFFYNFFTIYETDHGITLQTVSYLWTFSIIWEILIFYFQTPLFKKFDLLTIIKITVFMTIVRWLLLYLFPSSITVSYISQALHAFSFALNHTAAISYLYATYDNKKLSSQFYYGISFGLGGFIGALLAGYLYGDNLFLYAAIIAGLSLLFISFQKDDRPIVLKQNF